MLFFSVHLRPPRFTLFPYTTLFRSLTLDWTCPEDLRDQQPLIGGETCHFTYGDLQAEMDLINRAYIDVMRSEEHTSELQSRGQLVCRLRLEKKNSRRWQRT